MSNIFNDNILIGGGGWQQGFHHPKKNNRSILEELYEAKGKLDPDQARIWFAKFCKANLGFAARILIGVDLKPIQELKVRSFFLRDFILDIEGRGSGKSFVISVFIVLYALFNPGCKIGICSGTFRQSRLIFKQIEDFINSVHPWNGSLLAQCVPRKPSHAADLYEMYIGKSVIRAVPLTEKIRGLRFNVVILDELLLIPSKIIDEVILPFLSASQDGMSNHELFEAETKLIKAGKLREDQRSIFPSNKVIGLSSASFKFEDLYKKYYEPYLKRIHDPKAGGMNHCLIKLSYEAAPPGLMNLNAIEEAKSNNSASTFDREYRAIFTDDGSGCFSMEKIMAVSVPLGQEPKVKLKGDPGKKYILAIDPNFSESETSDHFAMAVLELDEEDKKGTLVHGLAVAGGKLSDKSYYLKYLLENFNFVYIIIDNAGSAFFSQAKEFLGDSFPKTILEFEDTFLDGEEGLRLAKKAYNPITGAILHKQIFNKAQWIRLANENLAHVIQQGKLWFASPLKDDSSRALVKRQSIPVDKLVYTNLPMSKDIGERLEDFIDNQEYIIELTKKEVTLIEVTSNMSGHLSYDLPANLKISTSPQRARKDSYTALLLAAWAMKCYFDLNKIEDRSKNIFLPSWIA